MKVPNRLSEMKRQSIRMIAISFALLLFSAVGVRAIMTTAYAIKPQATETMILESMTPGSTASSTPQDPTATATIIVTPTNTVQATATPTQQVTPVTTPTHSPLPTATNGGFRPTPHPTQSTGSGGVLPPISTTVTVLPSVTATTAQPTPTPATTPTASATMQSTPTVGNQSHREANFNNGNGTMGKNQSNTGLLSGNVLTVSGVSAAVLIFAALLIGFDVRRRKQQALKLQAVPAIASYPSLDRHNEGFSAVAPSAGLAFAQFPPTLNVSGLQMASPTAISSSSASHRAILPQSSDLNPLSIDFPQIVETHPTMSSQTESQQGTPSALLQSQLPLPPLPLMEQSSVTHEQLPFPLSPDHFSPPTQQEASSPKVEQTVTPVVQEKSPVLVVSQKQRVVQQSKPYQVVDVRSDPRLQALMRQAQTGIFTLPNTDKVPSTSVTKDAS